MNWWWTTADDLMPLRQAIDSLSEEVRALRTTLVNQGAVIMADLSRLQSQVQANTDAEAAAVTLITGLADQLRAAATDPAAVTALADQLKSSADSLAAAVVANTPAA